MTRELILLAVGPEGGAALARWVAEHGRDGVAGVGLVGVTAPWAEREPVFHPVCSIPGCDHEEAEHVPLGPLEPLRAEAERARCGVCRLCGGEGSGPCGDCGGRGYPLRLIVACALDDGVCGGGCDDLGMVPTAPDRTGAPLWKPCPVCTGSGKALSSLDVARELVPSNAGGAEIIEYATRAELDEHGLRAVVERLVR